MDIVAWLRGSGLALALASLAACGGPLAYTVSGFDAGALPPEKRSALDKLDQAVDAARKAADDAKQAVSVAEGALDEARDSLSQKKGDLDVASAALDLEKTKSSAGQGSDVSGAESTRDARKKAVEVAERAEDLAEAQLDLARANAKVADKSWIVALAEREKARLDAQGGSGPDHDGLVAKLDKQLAEANAAQADAREDAAEAQKDVDEAKQKLADAQS